MSVYSSKNGEIQELLSKAKELSAEIASLAQEVNGNVESIKVMQLKKKKKDINVQLHQAMCRRGEFDGGDIA